MSEPNIKTVTRFSLTTRLKETLSGWVTSIVDRIFGTGDGGAKEMKTAGLDTRKDCKDEEKFDIASVPKPEALTSKYDIGEVIGEGDYAFVLECTDKQTKIKHALKVFKKSSEYELETRLENEVRILRGVSHPNIIQLYDDFSCNDFFFEIIELLNGGYRLIPGTKHTEADSKGMIYNLASALEYLHSRNIVHRDVRLINVLINNHEDGTKSLKLGYFGIATEVNGPLNEENVVVEYMAPEVVKESSYGLKVDVWSAGVIAFELLSGRLPFQSPRHDADEIVDLIVAGKYDFSDSAWADVSDSAKNLISGMLTVEPEKRFSASQVLDDPWMSCSGSNDKNVTTSFTRRFRAL